MPFPTPSAFNAFLSAHGQCTPQGIWLKIAKKAAAAANTTSISYDEAVDVALCHGWIDGQRRRSPDDDDAAFFLQRFTPRRRNSLWSRRNVDRVARLTAAQGSSSISMRPAGLSEVEAAKRDGRWARAYVGPAAAEVPPDFARALAASPQAAEAWAALGRTAR